MNKKAIRSELVEKGKWTRFCAERNRLEKEGLSPDEAYASAAGSLLGKPVDSAVGVRGGQSSTVFKSGSASTPACVAWVAKNLLIQDAKPGDAPGSEAWGMLMWARRNEQNEAQFWGSIYTKLLPSRNQLDSDSRYTDDGRRVLDLIEKLDMELNEAQG